MKDLILSKRVVGIGVGLVLRGLAHYHIIVPDGVQEDIVNAVIDCGTAAWVIVTKYIDAKNAKQGA